MKENDIHDNLYWLFLKATFRTKQQLVKLAEDYDLTIVQMYTLCSMRPEHPLQMNEIAHLLVCDPSNVTGIIDRLLVGQLIERKENPKDRRVKIISLTKQGIKLRLKLFEAIMNTELESLKSLSESQKKTLRELLTHIVAA